MAVEKSRRVKPKILKRLFRIYDRMREATHSKMARRFARQYLRLYDVLKGRHVPSIACWQCFNAEMLIETIPTGRKPPPLADLDCEPY